MRKTSDKQGTLWTASELNFLKNNIEMDDAFISRRIGRSVYAVKSMRYKFLRGLQIPDDDYVQPGLLMTHDEKVSRIYRMAAEMRIRLEK